MSLTLGIRWNLANNVKIYHAIIVLPHHIDLRRMGSCNHRTSIPHRSETNGIAEKAVRRIKEGTSAAPLQSGLDEKWADSMEYYCYLQNAQDLLANGKHLMRDDLGII